MWVTRKLYIAMTFEEEVDLSLFWHPNDKIFKDKYHENHVSPMISSINIFVCMMANYLRKLTGYFIRVLRRKTLHTKHWYRWLTLWRVPERHIVCRESGLPFVCRVKGLHIVCRVSGLPVVCQIRGFILYVEFRASCCISRLGALCCMCSFGASCCMSRLGASYYMISFEASFFM